ncbi:MAG TPA: BlaI/MecI/CopY family transcriptional regulator [Candidatus Aenigmarchaeota archaeon]|nr:BlaI/MecI/CopY family transcriptional regulator [Candidatus Aenigmarchaeota archaeon]
MVKVDCIRFNEKSVAVLSPLENDVLRILWKKDSGMRVRDIYQILKKKRKVALTSVAVILDRLHEKKIVVRKIEFGLGGEHYIYCSSCSKSDFEHTVVEKTVNRLIDKFGPVAVTYFNERFSKRGKK